MISFMMEYKQDHTPYTTCYIGHGICAHSTNGQGIPCSLNPSEDATLH
jgi:hypothetical protein